MPLWQTGRVMVLGTLINHPELLGRDTLYELRNIVARYPYFQTARLLMLSNMYLLHDPDFGNELRRSVLYVPDRRALCRLIEGYTERGEAEVLMPDDEPTMDRTMSLIDAFLGTLPEEHDESLLIATDAVSDYAIRFLNDSDEVPSVTAADGASHTTTSDDSVLRAIELMSQKDVRAEDLPSDKLAELPMHVADEEQLEEGYFTETLAKIYIKQRKYSRALEIIRSLYLQFPEKNAYFADQIRFLEKLIINNNLK